jgi:hypothetical protein
VDTGKRSEIKKGTGRSFTVEDGYRSCRLLPVQAPAALLDKADFEHLGACLLNGNTSQKSWTKSDHTTFVHSSSKW